MMIRYIRGIIRSSMYIDGVIGGAFCFSHGLNHTIPSVPVISNRYVGYRILNTKLKFEIKFTLPASL